MNYESVLERMLQHYTGTGYKADVEEARADFFDRAGMFDETSVGFELKMAQFTDWYLFSRRLNGPSRTPIDFVFEDVGYEIPESEKLVYQNMRNSRHSLFEFLKLKGDDVYIRDLFSGFKYVIRKSKVTLGFDPREYFEARLFPTESDFTFSPSFCFHPATVSRYILSEVKRVNKLPEEQRQEAREDLMAKLYKMRNKHDQYRHLKLSDIYSNESKLRL